MSSFILYTDPGQALVATDTLAVKPDGTPLMYCSKAVYLPHLKTIIAGTGVGGFANNWANHVNNNVTVGGLMNLNYHTPAALRKRWKDTSSEPDFPEGLTTTVYQIGVAEDSDEIRAFAYRSTNDFESEPLNHGMRFKPECTVEYGDSLVDSLKIIMEDQRRIQESKPEGERLYIGGECVAMHLTPVSCKTLSVFKFDDHADMLREMFDGFRRRES